MIHLVVKQLLLLPGQPWSIMKLSGLALHRWASSCIREGGSPKSHATLPPNTKRPTTESWAAVWAGGHTSLWLYYRRPHPGFPLGVSTQRPPRESSRQGQPRTSPSHLQVSVCRRNAYTQGTQERAPLPQPCSDLTLWLTLREPKLRPHLRSVLSAREMAGFLTALLQAALLLKERFQRQGLHPGRKRSGSPDKRCSVEE